MVACAAELASSARRSLWLPENRCGFRVLVVLRCFYGDARNKACESNEADRYQMIAAERGFSSSAIKRGELCFVANLSDASANNLESARRSHGEFSSLALLH